MPSSLGRRAKLAKTIFNVACFTTSKLLTPQGSSTFTNIKIAFIFPFIFNPYL
jgi:hypothetical protein